MVELIVEKIPSYRDEATYEGKRISFYKRAQILVADFWGVMEARGEGDIIDMDWLTMFADYRVPQALVYLGALRYSDALMQALKNGELLSSGDRKRVAPSSVTTLDLLPLSSAVLWAPRRRFPGQPSTDNKRDQVNNTTYGDNNNAQTVYLEVLHNHQVCVRVVPDTAQVMLGSDRLFNFDHAFGPTASQDEVYESCVQPLVESLIDGYNATVFCYGQTGSGKTYTLGGGKLGKLH
ncbi:Kinesin-like protein KIF27 [Larimichthys crocea]|uniref:Queuosine 5'-phosphate N-glycosylase/hydrolase n=1 Tax=Larimichthys crocea TaxID=215358 RepID=A0A6G0IKY5_LARCR|nr:Kinesin-like protein KIF27 [Larimichthys crocea]